jgi:hypothetical protein
MPLRRSSCCRRPRSVGADAKLAQAAELRRPRRIRAHAGAMRLAAAAPGSGTIGAVGQVGVGANSPCQTQLQHAIFTGDLSCHFFRKPLCPLPSPVASPVFTACSCQLGLIGMEQTDLPTCKQCGSLGYSVNLTGKEKHWELFPQRVHWKNATSPQQRQSKRRVRPSFELRSRGYPINGGERMCAKCSEKCPQII